MTVIMCQPRFVPKILGRTKLQTIRAERKKPIRVGEHLSLRMWQDKAYRSPQLPLLEADCTNTCPVTLQPMVIIVDGRRLTHVELDSFAMLDGFDDILDMMAWFETEHGLPLRATLIGWDPWVCKHCGCSDTAACPGGCSWSLPRECSACVNLRARDLDLMGQLPRV